MNRKKITPISYDGIELTTKGRRAFFEYDSGAFDTPRHNPISLDRLNRFPSYVRSQPEGKTFPLGVTILSSDSQQQFETLSRIFDPSKGLRYLRVEDCDSRLKRMLCVPQQMIVEQRSEKPLVVPLWAPEPLLEDNAATTALDTIDALNNPIIFSPFNLGTYDALPIFTITPRQLRTAAQGYSRMREITYANRSEFALTGPGSGTWSIDVTNGGWNTAALISAGQMQADGDDIAVFVDGIQVPPEKVRIQGINTTTTKVWIEIADAPAHTAVLESAIVAGTITFTFRTAEHSFQPGDYLVWLNAAAAYEQARVTTAAGDLVTVARGVRNTTAGAAVAGTIIYKAGHHIQLAWNWSAAPARPTDPDPPLIDLTTSTNLLWEWTTAPIWPDSNRRPGGWRRILYDGREDVPELRKNRLSAKTSLDAVFGVGSRFSDDEPTMAKPNFDALEFRACCGVDDVLGAIEYDCDLDWPFCLQVIGRDLLGLDSIIFNRLGHETGAAHLPPRLYINQQEIPSQIMSAVIFRARQAIVTTCRPADTVEEDLADLLAVGHDLQQFALDEETQLIGIVARARHETAGTVALQTQINEIASDDTPGSRVAGPFSGAGALGAVLREVCFFPSPAAAFTTDIPSMAAGDYFLSISEQAGTGNIRTVRSNATIYAKGDHWEYDGAVFVRFPDEDLWFALLSINADNQEETLNIARTGEALQLRNIKIIFDPNRTPIVDPRPVEDAYYFDVRYVTALNSVRFRYLARWAIMQDTAIEINVRDRTVFDWATLGSVRQALTILTDPWWSLPAGSSSISVEHIGGAVEEDHRVEFRSVWQA